MPSSSSSDISIATGTCTARAALAGNPSDGFSGAVVSTPVRSVMATVEASRADRFELCPSPTDDDTFSDLAALVESVDRVGYGDARQLVAATLRSVHRHAGADIGPARLTVSTTIPRSVGLAGSSAIVIATIRALCAMQPHAAWSHALRGDPSLLAAIALDAERRELGIAAGLQDRVVQAFEATMSMDFSTMTALGSRDLSAGRYDRLPRPPGALFVAALDLAAAPSGAAHRSLRDDFDANRGSTRRLMSEIAETARSAATAIERGDIDALGAAMDATLDIRQSMMVLDPRHLAMAEIARSHGCHANWAGSGGAVTVLAPHEALATTTSTALRTELGCTILAID